MAKSTWSRDPEDLSDEPLLRPCPRVDFHGAGRPSVGRYLLLSKLGQGGMGVVYHATHHALGNEVAVKLQPRGAAQAEVEMLGRFRREARLAAQLRSPHLVSVLDIADDEPSGCHFIVMEYVHGVSAAQWLGSWGGHAPEADALDVCIAATRGLEAAHLNGVIHRDIKPANILIPFGPARTPLCAGAKLADLGLARADAGEDAITRTQAIMGTPGNMSPEQARSARKVRKPADVLGMGATLYKLLTNKAPFFNPETEEWLEWTFLGKHLPATEHRPDITRATAALLETCLALEPKNRFPDASALLAALKVARAAIANRNETETIVEEVRSLVTRSEQGLPVPTSTDGTTALPYPDPETERPPPATPFPSSTTPAPRAASRPATGGAAIAAGEVTPVPPTPPAAGDSPTPVLSTPTPVVAPPAPKSRAPLVVGLLLVAAAAAVIAWAPWSSPPRPADAPAPAVAVGLAVTSTPDGAAVAVDGVERGRTPLRISDLAEGRHSVRVVLDDYVAWSSTSVETKTGERTPLHVDLVPAKGRVAVTGGPAAAHVSLTRRGGRAGSDEFALGPDGRAEREVEAGDYEIQVVAAGYEPSAGNVRVRGGQAASYVAGLRKLPSDCTVDSTPSGAEVLVDGKAVGRTPLSELPLASGRHVLTIRAAEHVDFTCDVDVAPGEHKTLPAATLQPWGTLDLSGLDPDVTVRAASGEALRDGAARPPAPFDVVLSKPDHAPQRRTVEVAPGGRARIEQEPWEKHRSRLDLSRLESGVRAFVDGEERTGKIVNLVEGRTLHVELRRDGFASQVQDVRLDLGEVREIAALDWRPRSVFDVPEPVSRPRAERWAPLVREGGMTLRSLSCAADGRHGLTVGDKGVVLSTADGGRTWSGQSSLTTNRLWCVQFHDDARRGWAVGDDGVVIASVDGGISWTTRPTGVENRLVSLCFLPDAEHGWAVGQDGTIVSTTDGGRNWAAQILRKTPDLHSVHFLADAKRGWAAGAGGVVLSTVDGGETWMTRTVVERKDLHAVRFAEDGQSGWTVGEDGVCLATSDGGASWARAATGTTKDLFALHFLPDGLRGWAVGDNGVIVSTVDGGRRWNVQHDPMTNDLFSVQFTPDGSRGWAAGEDGVILTSGEPECAAWIRRVESEPLADCRLRVTFVVADEQPSAVKILDVRVRSVGTQASTPSDATTDARAVPTIVFEWNPRALGVAAGAEVFYEVTLRDAAGHSWTHEIAHGFPYDAR